MRLWSIHHHCLYDSQCERPRNFASNTGTISDNVLPKAVQYEEERPGCDSFPTLKIEWFFEGRTAVLHRFLLHLHGTSAVHCGSGKPSVESLRISILLFQWVQFAFYMVQAWPIFNVTVAFTPAAVDVYCLGPAL